MDAILLQLRGPASGMQPRASPKPPGRTRGRRRGRGLDLREGPSGGLTRLMSATLKDRLAKSDARTRRPVRPSPEAAPIPLQGREGAGRQAGPRPPGDRAGGAGRARAAGRPRARRPGVPLGEGRRGCQDEGRGRVAGLLDRTRPTRPWAEARPRAPAARPGPGRRPDRRPRRDPAPLGTVATPTTRVSAVGLVFGRAFTCCIVEVSCNRHVHAVDGEEDRRSFKIEDRWAGR